MKTFQELAAEIGELVTEKNTAYGSSFGKAGDFLRLLWPDGIPANRFDDALLLVRIFDKQMRIATDKDAFGESPYGDISGYGILGLSLHQEKSETWQGSASVPDVTSPPKGQPASAARTTNEPTTTNESEQSAPKTSPNTNASPASSSAPASTPTVSALAHDAMAVARRRVVAHVLARNREGFCGHCSLAKGSVTIHHDESDFTFAFRFCSTSCRDLLRNLLAVLV